MNNKVTRLQNTNFGLMMNALNDLADDPNREDYDIVVISRNRKARNGVSIASNLIGVEDDPYGDRIIALLEAGKQVIYLTLEGEEGD
jgi:phosphopantothenate synthetase